MGAGSKENNSETYGSEGSLKLDPNLKYDTSGSTPIVLIPQPSDDPNDPLVRCALYCIGGFGMRDGMER